MKEKIESIIESPIAIKLWLSSKDPWDTVGFTSTTNDTPLTRFVDRKLGIQCEIEKTTLVVIDNDERINLPQWLIDYEEILNYLVLDGRDHKSIKNRYINSNILKLPSKEISAVLALLPLISEGNQDYLIKAVRQWKGELLS